MCLSFRAHKKMYKALIKPIRTRYTFILVKSHVLSIITIDTGSKTNLYWQFLLIVKQMHLVKYLTSLPQSHIHHLLQTGSA